MSKVITKKSVGIIFFSKSLNNVLFIQKKTTYEFMDFLLGKYSKSNRSKLVKMFSNMTLQEKSVLLSMRFDYIWYYTFSVMTKSAVYYKSLNKFTDFTSDCGKLLRQLIFGTSHVESTLWEAPKGRKKAGESDIISATREVYEETGIDVKTYKIIPEFKYKNIFIENNIRYNIIYYVARMLDCYSTSINVNDVSRLQEVMNISWLSVNLLDRYNVNTTLKNFIKHNKKIIKLLDNNISKIKKVSNKN